MRRAILYISIQLLLEIMKGLHESQKGYFEVVEHALPDDAKLVDYHIEGLRIALIIESDTFKNIPIPEPYPILTPPTLKYTRVEGVR